MIKLEAELKTAAAPDLIAALSEAPAGEPLSVDASAVTFLGGACLQALAAAAQAHGEGLVIVAPSPELLADLTTLGASEMFRIEGGAA